MGLAERFKNRLDNRDIFTKTNIEKQFKEQDIEFISKPITHETNIQPKEIHLGLKSEPIIELSTDIKSNKFEDLEDEIINKIRKTPYWEDFSTNQKEKMISSYFDARIQKNKYSKIVYLENDKIQFVENILTLSNNR